MDSKGLLQFYKVFRTTNLVKTDIKLIRKYNTLIDKYHLKNMDKYLYESKNIIIMLSNIFEITDLFVEYVLDNNDFSNITEETFKEEIKCLKQRQRL